MFSGELSETLNKVSKTFKRMSLRTRSLKSDIINLILIFSLIHNSEYYLDQHAEQVPYMIVCPLHKREKLPLLVSLTSEACAQSTNILEIINNQPSGVKREFGVCSKQLFFEDRGFGIKFIEWVHLLRILGAHKIHLYKEKVHNDIENVVEYLDEKGFIDIKPFIAPSNLNATTFHSSLRRTLK